jgi:hypothetical protein
MWWRVLMCISGLPSSFHNFVLVVVLAINLIPILLFLWTYSEQLHSVGWHCGWLW